jgi:hypothetical protein
MRDMRDENRRAKVFLNRTDMHHLLALPDDLRVVSVHGSYDPPGVYFIVEGPALAPQPMDCEVPNLGGLARARRLMLDGQVFIRWQWQPDESGCPDPLAPPDVAAPLTTGGWSVADTSTASRTCDGPRSRRPSGGQ